VRVPRPAALRRWILKLALCLLAGAMITWGAAWGCALWMPPAGQRPSDLPPVSMGLPEDLAKGWTDAQLSWVYWSPVHETRVWHIFYSEGPGRTLSLTDFGWPFHSMHGARGSPLYDLIRRSTLLRPPSWLLPNERCLGLPVTVLPRGFAINTLIAAGVVLGLVEGFAFARGRVRRAKGRCPSCGYDRKGLAMDAACPECGEKA
jgi:hypothetical protein